MIKPHCGTLVAIFKPHTHTLNEILNLLEAEQRKNIYIKRKLLTFLSGVLLRQPNKTRPCFESLFNNYSTWHSFLIIIIVYT